MPPRFPPPQGRYPPTGRKSLSWEVEIAASGPSEDSMAFVIVKEAIKKRGEFGGFACRSERCSELGENENSRDDR
jgi:hypothetical protein